MHVVFFSTEAKCELVKQYMRRKMRKRAKKALALLLALSCSFSTYVSAATIANETVLSEGIKQSFPEEKSTTSSENVIEENALEEDAGILDKIEIHGALSLYLDFVNLFIYILRILGRRK